MLVQNGFHVTMLVREDSPIHRVIHDESPHIKVEFCPDRVRNYFDAGMMKTIRRLVDKSHINLIHCHQTTILGSIVPALVGRNHVALVASRHILNSHNKKDPFHAVLYRRVDYILVLSKTMKRNMLATFPVEEKKLRTVNLAIDLERFSPGLENKQQMRQEWGVPKGAFLVGVVGRLDPMKGQDLLIKALAQVKKKIPNVHGVMVGNETPGLDGEYIRELQDSLAQLHLSESVTIAGSTPNVPAVMCALDLFVMPSWSEAFGLVALEAMAMEVPCLLSRAGSAEELALASGSALFRPKDAYDLAKRIIYLYEHPELRLKAGRRAREFVVENHGKQVRLHKTLEIYGRCYRRRIAKDKSLEH
jgi:glycosyltransferase involved in cell wall biosynthesis